MTLGILSKRIDGRWQACGGLGATGIEDLPDLTAMASKQRFPQYPISAHLAAQKMIVLTCTMQLRAQKCGALEVWL